MPIDKNTVIKEAQKFASKGQYDKAIAEWKKLIREYPNDANIYNTIGDLSLKKNAKPDAVDAYKKAADILAAEGFTSKAIALYKKILNIDPKKVEVHLALADLNAEKGLVGNALASYKVAADHYMQKNDMAAALGIYQKMADLDLSNVAFRIKLAEMYSKEGLKKEAAKAYLEAADVYLSKEAFQEARQIFESVLSIDPNNKDVYFKAGVLYHKEGKFADACKALKPAFDADPSNKELADVYIDSLIKTGRREDAEAVIRKLLAQDDSLIDLRERLYRLLLSKRDYDNALAEAALLIDKKVEAEEFGSAEEILKEFITQNPEHIGARRRLSAFYQNVKRDDDAVRELMNLADVLITKGDRDGARAELQKALEISPDSAEARQRLDVLDRPISPEPEAAVISIPGLEESPQPQLQGMPPAGLEDQVVQQPEAKPSIEEDPSIEEAFTEIDVLIKYGLTGKAVEQLESLSIKFPSSIRIKTRLKELYRAQGNVQKVVEVLLSIADVYEQHGMPEEAKDALREGLESAPDSPEIQARLGIAPPPKPAEEPISLEQTLRMEGTPSAFEMEVPAPEEPVIPPPEVVPQAAAMEVPVEETPAVEPLSTEDVSEIWAEAEFYYQQGLFDEALKHYKRIIALAPDNQRARERISELSREKEEVQEFSRLAEAVEGLEGLVPSDVMEPAAAESISDEEAVRSLMQEIEQLKHEKKGEIDFGGAREAPLYVPQREEPQPRQKEDFFDLGSEISGAGPPALEPGQKGSEDFFDLAAELREELASASIPEGPVASAREQTLDDIFEEFKRGVEAQAGMADSDTHYNLGIAYKEMGLLDDAIAEFLLTREGEPMFVESRHMLGLCYMEQGEYQKAATEIRNALSFAESLGADPVQKLNMLYDLGLALQGIGYMGEALNTFQQVYDADPSYRDVSAKLRELKEGDYVSLDQLKEEIEREISAKFLEEGERIEREEKTRKSEKVRG